MPVAWPLSRKAPKLGSPIGNWMTFPWFRRRSIDPTQLKSWDRDGYLILSKLLSGRDIATVLQVVDDQWSAPLSPYHVDMLTGADAGRSFRIGEAPAGSRDEAYKLNNLFALVPEIRQVALQPGLKETVAALLGGEPLICNSLNFERGSQQDLHIDSWYMPPPADGKMVAASFALDAVTPANGPIVYLAGSHRIPAYRFSDGRLNEIPSEAAACRAYLDEEIARRQLTQNKVQAQPGDVFLWHGQLLHGGAAIEDFTKTRRSLVVHYWRAEDVPSQHVRRDRHGAYLAHTLRGELKF